MRDVFLDWHLGDNFGWGVLGLNLFLQWADDPDVRPVMGHPIARVAIGPCDPLRLARVQAAIERSNAVLAGLRAGADGSRSIRATVIEALGNDFASSSVRGDVNVARCIFEDTTLAGVRGALQRHDALLTASNWNADLVEAATGRRPTVIFEGVDTSLFCPGPRSATDDARFYVFSGGKVEFRKGQDLVLLAFRAFHQRHPDSVLVTAWQSIWPHLATGFRGRLAAPVELAGNGLLDIAGWSRRNGIAPGAVVDCGLVPNAAMPSILREMHVALQPSRAEACTNLPVKEAMACGVPVIAAANTGMRDLLCDDNAIVLKTQTPLVGPGAASMDGWCDSDIDEMVAALEFAYRQREEVARLGLRARDWLVARDRTWRAHAIALKTWITSLN